MWKTNRSNKIRLAKDFKNKCAYCDDLDKYSGGYNSYHVEHFAPKEKFKHLEFTYDNLLYSCPYCNISKSNKWVSEDPMVNCIEDKGFLDPCGDEYYKHLARDTSGKIVYTSKFGKYIYYELKLYLRRHEILNNLEKIRIKRKELEVKMQERKEADEDYSKLELLHYELCSTFCRYYDILIDEMD